MAESIYAALLYPKRINKAADLFRKESVGNSILNSVRFNTLTAQVKKATDAFINRQNWGAFGLVGVSISFCQLTSALYIIQRIKRKFPGLMTVVGGASASGRTAYGLLKSFPQIDAVVIGEGELPLNQIIEQLRQSQSNIDLTRIQGVLTGEAIAAKDTRTEFAQMDTLNDLPVPDYDDYFQLLNTFDARKAFFPTLPVEISRGCWWKPTAKTGRVSGCAFCNLNLQWRGYRYKSPSQVIPEIDHLTRRHQSLSITITDNVLPRKGSVQIFKRIGSLNKDLRLFGEVRPTTPRLELIAMRDCGMQQVQVGIEALSSSLLKKLNKGTTVIQNLQIMKNCEALGIENRSNLILQFPGSDERDVTQTLNVLDFAKPFYPLKAVDFWLGLGSPVWQNPKRYGIKSVFNHPNWSYIFPEKIRQTVPLMIQSYRGDRVNQKKNWKSLKKKIFAWQMHYAEIQQGTDHRPILSYQDGREFIIIRQKYDRAQTHTHRLVGRSRSIYLFCDQHRSLKRICAQFPAIANDKILNFLKMMVAKKLMFEENDRYLSLAIRVH